MFQLWTGRTFHQDVPTAFATIRNRQWASVSAERLVLNPASVKAINSSNDKPGPENLRARVDGRVRDCLLNSEADICLIPSLWIDPNRIKSTSSTLAAANGTDIFVNGQVQLIVRINDKIFLPFSSSARTSTKLF